MATRSADRRSAGSFLLPAVVFGALGGAFGAFHAADALGEIRLMPGPEAGRILFGGLSGVVGYVGGRALGLSPAGGFVLAGLAGYQFGTMEHITPYIKEVVDGAIPPELFNSDMLVALKDSGVSLTDPMNKYLLKAYDGVATSLTEKTDIDPYFADNIAAYDAARADYLRLARELEVFSYEHSHDFSFMPGNEKTLAEFNEKLAAARAAYIKYLEEAARISDIADGKTIVA